MFETMIEMFSYPFMVRAFLVGSLVALCSALLGVSLVLLLLQLKRSVSAMQNS